MRLKPYLIDTARSETRILKHLVSKLDPERVDYRPSPGQRSTLELLQYLTQALVGASSFAIAGTWGAWGERSKALTLSQIPAALDAQLAEFERLLAGVSEEDLDGKQVAFPWGPKGALGTMLLDLPLRWLSSYKMQLFLYAKASGAPQLASSNLWSGSDPKPAAAKG